MQATLGTMLSTAQHPGADSNFNTEACASNDIATDGGLTVYMASNLCGHTPKVKLSASAHSATEGAGSRALSGSATPATLWHDVTQWSVHHTKQHRPHQRRSWCAVNFGPCLLYGHVPCQHAKPATVDVTGRSSSLPDPARSSGHAVLSSAGTCVCY
jgi:hypothetical protein